MRKHLEVLTFLTFICLTGCATSHRVHPADSESARGKQGVYYWLPLTVVNVDIPVKLSIVKPGAYFPCAKAVLGEEPKTPGKFFSVGEPVVTFSGSADPKNVYLVQVKGGPFENRELELELTRMGLLTSATSSVEDKTLDIAIATVKTAAEVAGALLKGADTQAVPADKTLTIDCTMARQRKKDLDSIRSLRLNLISGKTAPEISNDALRTMLSELDRIENSILEEFLGKTFDIVFIAKFQVVPGAAGGKYHLLSWDNEKGVNVDPTYSLIDAPLTWPVAGSIRIDLAISPITPSAVDIVKANYSTGNHVNGYYYRAPADGRVAVEKGGSRVFSTTHPIAQFGAVVALPNSTGSIRKSTYAVTLDTDTGALLKLKASSTALDPATIEAAGSAAGAWADYIKKKREIEQAAEDSRKEQVQAAVDSLLGLSPGEEGEK